MGRSIVTAQVPILGSIFRNSSQPSTLATANGAVFKALPVTYQSSAGLINTVDFPIGAPAYMAGNSLVSYGAYLSSAVGTFGDFGIDTYQINNEILTWCVQLARGSTDFQSNKTENFVSQSREINGNLVGHLNAGSGSYNYSFLSRMNISGGYLQSASRISYVDVAAYYYDTVNSRHAWIGNGSKWSTADGLSFTSSAITGLTGIEYQRVIRGFRPFVAISGSNGVFLQRATSGANQTLDYITAWRTTNNFSSVTNISTSLIPGGASYGYPHLINYDGTRLFVLSGGADGSPANMSARFTADFGATFGSSTLTGDAASFHGMSGYGANFSAIAGSHLASCSGANASSFMYLSSSYGQYFAYYTSNGGQSFISKSLSSLVSGLGSNSDKDGFIALSYANGVWVALFQKEVSGIYSLRSTDNGATWSTPTLVFTPDSYPAQSQAYIGQILTHNNQFVAFKMSVNRIRFAKSTDGTTWTALDNPFFGYGYSNCYVELASHFIVGGCVLRKSDLTIIGFHNQPGYVQSSANLATMAVPTNKMVNAFSSWGGALVTDTEITNSVRTTSLLPQPNAYSTSGSIYGAYEYVRLK